MLAHDVNVHLYSTDHFYIEDIMKKKKKVEKIVWNWKMTKQDKLVLLLKINFL